MPTPAQPQLLPSKGSLAARRPFKMTVKRTEAVCLAKVAGLEPAMLQEASSLACLEGGLLVRAAAR